MPVSCLLRPGVLLATMAVIGGVAAGPAAADSSLSTGFEGQSLDALSLTSGVTVSPLAAEDGLFGARAASTASSTAYLTWNSSDVEQGDRYARFSGWVQAHSFDAGTTLGMFSVKNTTGEHHFDFFYDETTGKWRWDLLRSDHAMSTMDVVEGRWYYVQALVDFGGPTGTTYTARVSIDGQEQDSITSVDQPGATVKSAWMGSRTVTSANVRYYDDIRMDVGDSPFAFRAVPAAAAG